MSITLRGYTFPYMVDSTRQNCESVQLHVLTVVKIKINVQDAAELLSQFVNSKDYIIDVTESFSFISS